MYYRERFINKFLPKFLSELFYFDYFCRDIVGFENE